MFPEDLYPMQEYVPWYDDQAVLAHPEHKWVYDKLELSRMLNEGVTYDLAKNEIPEKFPVFVKPRVNLEGMGIDAEKVKSLESLQFFLGQGYIAQPFQEGDHYSIDFLVYEGEIYSENIMKAVKRRNTIVEWHSCPNYPVMADKHVNKLLEEFNKHGGYNGVVNIEMIGNYVLEVHLRPSVCFADIDQGMCEEHHWVQLGEAPTNLEPYYPTYAIIGRVRQDMTMAKFLPTVPTDNYKGIVSIQYTGRAGRKLSDEPNDPYSYKLFEIHCLDLVEGRAYAEMLKRAWETKLNRELKWV